MLYKVSSMSNVHKKRAQSKQDYLLIGWIPDFFRGFISHYLNPKNHYVWNQASKRVVASTVIIRRKLIAFPWVIPYYPTLTPIHTPALHNPLSSPLAFPSPFIAIPL